MTGDLSPARYVRAVKLDENGRVEAVQTLQYTVWEDPGVREGALAGFVEVPEELAHLDIAPRDSLNLATGEIVKAGPAPLPEMPEPTAADARRLAYPPLTEFAEALTERELGNDTKWQAYMARVRQVRAMPKA